jgi:hypothetical protein
MKNWKLFEPFDRTHSRMTWLIGIAFVVMFSLGLGFALYGFSGGYTDKLVSDLRHRGYTGIRAETRFTSFCGKGMVAVSYSGYVDGRYDSGLACCDFSGCYYTYGVPVNR